MIEIKNGEPNDDLLSGRSIDSIKFDDYNLVNWTLIDENNELREKYILDIILYNGSPVNFIGQIKNIYRATIKGINSTRIIIVYRVIKSSNVDVKDKVVYTRFIDSNETIETISDNSVFDLNKLHLPGIYETKEQIREELNERDVGVTAPAVDDTSISFQEALKKAKEKEEAPPATALEGGGFKTKRSIKNNKKKGKSSLRKKTTGDKSIFQLNMIKSQKYL